MKGYGVWGLITKYNTSSSLSVNFTQNTVTMNAENFRELRVSLIRATQSKGHLVHL